VIAIFALVALLNACGDGDVLQQSTGGKVLEVDGAVNEDAAGEGQVPMSIGAREQKSSSSSAIEVFNGGPNAHFEGAFGPKHAWPVVPIHVSVLGDGRVLAYGTDPVGKQGSALHYVVWDPEEGTGEGAFSLLSNVFGTDLFCGGQVLLPGSGEVLLIGGDAKVNGIRNYGNSNINLFDPILNSISQSTDSMTYKRWYATGVTLGNGEQVVLGGRDSKPFEGTVNAPATVPTYAPVPEYRQIDGTWRVLTSAHSEIAYGAIGNSWFYPRAWLRPGGDIFVLGHTGNMFSLNVAGAGAIEKYSAKARPSSKSLPSVMFAPGKILSIRNQKESQVIDINGVGEPVISPAGQLSSIRDWGSATVLANGQVWLNGGSAVNNELIDVAYYSEAWDPETNLWSRAAAATEARLYHSTSVLLRDGSVLTGGGGSPGPYTQLNGEIYYPSYLFRRNGSGEFIERPVIKKSPTTALSWGSEFTITTGMDMRRVTLVRNGSATHSFNNDTRFFDLPFTQDEYVLKMSVPGDLNTTPPGYYMLFVWNRWGVPSIAAMIRVGL
jgi:hypothetical protein